MSQLSDHIECKVLSDAFSEQVAGARLKAAVFFTFRFDPGFFEQEILPIFFDIPLSHAPMARVLHVADALRTSGPVAVYYDRRALVSEGASARTDFQRIGITHHTGYFHPKNVLALVERDMSESGGSSAETSLLVGCLSANLTRAGWWENVEVAHIEKVEAGAPCSFRNDLLGAIAVVRRLTQDATDHPALDEIADFVRRLVQEDQRRREGLLMPRIYSGQSDLPAFLEDVAGRRLRGKYLEIISPYFDDKESAKPLRELIDRFKPRETRVFLPKGIEGEALCSKEYWEALQAAGAVWARLPADVVRLTRVADRTVHAKVYRFFDPADRRETLFVGSVNFTNAGFGRAGNVESGFLIEREGRRRGEWWLEADERRPKFFTRVGESDNLALGPGTDLILRFDWSTTRAEVLWDGSSASPQMQILGSGVTIGTITPLSPGVLTPTEQAFATGLRDHLLSSSFVTVKVEDLPEATILVEETGTVDKPSLLSTLSADEILRFWSLLSDAQKHEFFETHARELNDPELERWISRMAPIASGAGMFATFAHVYLSFGNLERAVSDSLTAKNYRHAVDRLFGQKFDSLLRLVERVRDGAETDHVRGYITLLCAVQLLHVIRKAFPEFYARERARFALIDITGEALAILKPRFSFADEIEQGAFFQWFEAWFKRRAIAVVKEPVA